MFIHNLYAIVPFYGEDGSNRTYIIYSDGTKEILDLPLKSYLYKIFITLHLDPKFLQSWTHQVIGSKSNTPLTLTQDCVFIPIKMRQSFGKADGCFGYVRSSCITSYDNYLIHLDQHIELTTLSPKSYVSKKLKDARLLSYAYIDQRKKYEFMGY